MASELKTYTSLRSNKFLLGVASPAVLQASPLDTLAESFDSGSLIQLVLMPHCLYS